MARRAALNLGLDTPQEAEDYRRRVMREEAGVSSVRDLGRTGDFDACIRRFAADAGEYLAAIDIVLGDSRRKAYVVKVMSIQIMQLKGGEEADARGYLEGVIRQARVPCGVNPGDDSFWMDVAPQSLQSLVQILDTHRRRLLKARSPSAPGGFDDRVRYEIDGPICIRRRGVPPGYYAGVPFSVNIRDSVAVE